MPALFWAYSLRRGGFTVQRGRLVLDPKDYQFLWVIEFPLMAYDEDAQRFVASHHPFTAPVASDVELLDSDPKKVRGQHYDLVLNGVELGGGSIRIHQPQLQKKVLRSPQDSCRHCREPFWIHVESL